MGAALPRQNSSSTLTRGYLICIAATVLWSSTGILIRHLTETYRIPPLVLAFWRDLFLALALLASFAAFRRAHLRLQRRNLGFLLLYGFEISLFNSLWTISVALNGAAVSTVLAYSSAAFTAILGWRLFGESFGLVKISAVTLSMLGCVLISGAYSPDAWQVNALGILAGLLSGLAFAGYSLMGKAASQRGIAPWTTLTYSFAFAVPFLLSYNIGHTLLPEGVASLELLWLGESLAGWVALIFLAVGPTVGGFGLYTVSLTYLPASVANLIATLEPVLTALLAFMLLGERFNSFQWMGGTLILTGVIFLRLREGT